MRVLSVRQPYAWAIIHGGKDIENRNWSTKYRGPLAIHAGKQFDFTKAQWHDCSLGAYGEPWHSMARAYNQQPEHILGAVIGVVDLVNCIPNLDCDSPWKAGDDPDAFCWLLQNPRPLRDPLPMPGQLGLFEPKPYQLEILRRVLSSEPRNLRDLETYESGLFPYGGPERSDHLG